MRKLLVFAAPLALLACADEAVEEPAVDDGTMVEEEAAVMTTANGTLPGVHEVTAADGTITTATLNADGTHQTVDADGNVIEAGEWYVANGQTCFTNTVDGSDGEPTCWDETAPAEDGSFTVSNAEGTQLTVRPVS